MDKKNYRWADWFTLLCVVILFILASTRLGLTEWTENLEVAGWLLMLGAASGYLLGLWRRTWLLVLLASILTSLVVVPLTFILMLSQRAGLAAKAADLWIRITTTSAQVAGNQPVNDSILFLLAIAILFWFIGLTTGITLVRSGRPWIPLLILGVAVLVIEHYQSDIRRAFYSWTYALVMLVLLGRLFYLKFKQSMGSSGRNIGGDTEFDFNRGIILTAIAVSALTLMMPGIVHTFVYDSREQTLFTQRWERFTSNFENIFYALDESQQTREQDIANEMLLGTGQRSGEEPVLYIQASTKEELEFPFYWRGKAYTDYRKNVWSLGNAYRQFYKPLQQLRSRTPGAGQVYLKITVQSLLPQLTQVYSTGDVVMFTRSVEAAVTAETLLEKEILGYYVDPPLSEDQVYRFDTILAVPTYVELSDAGTEYPDWITKRYLQLPPELSERMVDLAHQITDEMPTPYDKAVAITQYLRSNIEYQAIIPAPPRKMDPIDWFLFEYKKGFCNYSASAEVLLLRIAGVPARLAVGYAQGTPANSGEGFIVQEDDSHAWPEVYFPNYGWVPFEPTGSLPEIDWSSTYNASRGGSVQPTTSPGELTLGSTDHLNGEDRALMQLDQLESGEITPRQKRKLSLFGWILVGLGSTVVTSAGIIAGIRIRRNWKVFKQSWQNSLRRTRNQIFNIPVLGYWLHSLELSPLERNFSAIEGSLLVLGNETPPGSTARDLAELLRDRLPSVSDEIQLLLDQYQRGIYSPEVIDPSAGREASRIVMKTAIRDWLETKWGKMARFFDRFG